jgi:hypothetical protein
MSRKRTRQDADSPRNEPRITPSPPQIQKPFSHNDLRCPPMRHLCPIDGTLWHLNGTSMSHCPPRKLAGKSEDRPDNS